jgi:integrase
MATFIKRGGKYQAVIRRKGFPTSSRTFHRKSDAKEWARHMEIKADRGELPTPIRFLEGYKVRDILERYRDEVTAKKRSADTETYIINAFLRQPIAKLTLAQVNTGHFSKYREERLRQIKPGTINRQFGIIRHAFDVAMREWEIPLRENPLARLKKLKVNDARSRRIKAEEWEAIKTAATVCRNLLMMPLIRLAIETAMRRGELLAMKWEHINFENRTLLIPVAKNGHSRTIPLTGEAIRILREIQNMKETGSMYVFSGVTGNAANHVWDRIVERAKIENLHFHDLRHEAISRFFEKGLSVPEVALISGHRDFRMLFRYTHLKAEDIARKLY